MSATMSEVLEEIAKQIEMYTAYPVAAGTVRMFKHKYDGYRVIEPDAVIYKRIADNYARDSK